MVPNRLAKLDSLFFLSDHVITNSINVVDRIRHSFYPSKYVSGPRKQHDK
jgi:hypothetical protein